MSDITWTAELVSTPTMTLREYYAGLAMKGFCSNPAIIDNNGAPGWVATAAIKHADALIEALQEAEG